MTTETEHLDVGSVCPKCPDDETLLFGKPDGNLYCPFHGLIVKNNEETEEE